MPVLFCIITLEKRGKKMSRNEIVTLTNMCMIYNENKVLVQDKVDKNWGGITFPGGHVEKGEAFSDAVIREVYEETGLKITSPKLCGIKDWINEDGSRYMVLCYKTNQYEGHLVSSSEGEVYWMSLEEMKQVKLAEGMDEMLEVFLNDDINEYFLYEKDHEWKGVLK